MDNQHLGRNSSLQFPPSVSQGSEMGPCEQEGGSERRVCMRDEGEKREARKPSSSDHGNSAAGERR